MDDCPTPKILTRRQFLCFGGMTAFSLGLMPRWLARASAMANEASRKTLVVLFQRGAADALSIIPPFADPNYQGSRPSIAISAPVKSSDAIDLDGRFGLHPSLRPLLRLWKEKRFAVVHAAGSDDSSRSHERAQDYMENGVPGRTSPDGWLNRALKASSPDKPGAFDGVAIVRPVRLPKILRGSYPVTSVESLVELPQETPESNEARKIIAKLPPMIRKDYTNKSFLSRDLDELAWLIKTDVGLRVAFADMPSEAWDHHYNESARMSKSLADLAAAVSDFFDGLGDRSEDVVLLVMTEFGRTLRENVAGGTDHGHAAAMLLFGGKIKGGRVYGRWPGLENENLFEGRDLRVTTDYRQVIGELLARHLAIRDTASVFPGGVFPPLGLI